METTINVYIWLLLPFTSLRLVHAYQITCMYAQQKKRKEQEKKTTERYDRKKNLKLLAAWRAETFA